MNRYYSQTTGCCYVEGIHTEMPADAVEISDGLYDAVIANPETGKVRAHDENGLPYLTDPEPESLADLIADKLAELDAVCAAAIVAGFECDALGETCLYPSKATDQSNLQASVLASILPSVDESWTTPFWCADSQGVWAYRDHTAAQIQQVGVDGKNAINAAIAQKIELEQQVEAAKTAAEVAAIIWPQDEVAA